MPGKNSHDGTDVVGMPAVALAAAERMAPPPEKLNSVYAYFILFSLNLISMILIAWVNNALQSTYIELASTNVILTQVNQRTTALTKAAQAANAPPNDVFNSLRIDVERERLRVGLLDLFTLVELEKKSLEQLAIPAQRNSLLGNLEQGTKYLHGMANAANQVFDYLARGDKKKAGSSMALNDHYFGEFLEAMANRNGFIDMLQSDLFLQGENYRSGLSTLLNYGILLLGLLDGLVAIYGIQLTRRANKANRAAHLSALALEKSDMDLRQLNENLAHLMIGQQRFVANAAHQLRTPIAGFKLQLERALKSSSMEEVRLALVQMHTASERVVRLTKQMLTLARADHQPGASHELNLIDLCVLAREVGLRFLPLAHAKNIELEFEPDIQPVHIRANAVLIEELVSNLIDNAVRYTADYGRIIVAVQGTPTPHLSVEDNGPGIPLAEREKVFERFHRIEGSTSDGAGLGLAIVRDIAVLHGGGVRLESAALGKGLRIHIDFPCPKA